MPSEAATDAPAAWLVVDGDRHPGRIGGYAFGSSTSSAPWLPATALPPVAVPAASAVRVELDDRATIESWTARAAEAADTTGDALTILGSGASPAEFTVPSAGDWVVSVGITYGDGLGDGAYYWHVVVE